MNPAQPNQTLSICMPISLKRKIVEHTQGEKLSLSAWVRGLIKKEMSC